MCSLSAFCLERVHFTLWSRFQKTPEFYNLWNSSKPDLSSGAHMGNQMLPSIPAASFLCLKNVCRSLSTVWNYSPGWAEKRQSAKECHLDSTQCPLICHDSTAQRRHNLQKCHFFVVHYKLLLLMLFFVVMLRNNLVALGIVLPRILVHALSSTNNLAVSGNSSLDNFVHLPLEWLNTLKKIDM